MLFRSGYPPFGVEMKITDDAGKELPWDGKTFGRLKVSGPAIAKAYFRVDANILDDAGFFDTGDIATVDRQGFMQITDRAKDVIKSGGEWISSIDIENVAMAHPAVAMAACIGMPHPKWDERPIVAVVLRPGAQLTRDELLAFYQTPVGRKVLEQMPQLMAHAAQLTQERLQRAVPEVDKLLGEMAAELAPSKQ